MKVLLLILVFTVITLIEVPKLIKKKLWGELTAFSVLLSTGFILSLLLTIGVKLPNPAKAIENLIKLIVPVGD